MRRVPAEYHKAIIHAIRSLSLNPRPEGKKHKKSKGQIAIAQFIAQYRLRVGPYRVLYDVDGHRKKVVVLKLVKKDEHTYK